MALHPNEVVLNTVMTLLLQTNQAHDEKNLFTNHVSTRFLFILIVCLFCHKAVHCKNTHITIHPQSTLQCVNCFKKILSWQSS